MTNRLLSLLAITLISMQSIALAHFTMTYPSSRGFDTLKEPLAPCGGYDTPTAERVQMPLKSSFIQIDSGHTAYTFVVYALLKNDPVNPDFIPSNLVQVAQGGRSYPEGACLPLTFNESVQPNTNVTLQVVYNGGDGLLYQCVDAVLVDSAPSFDASKCVNADGSNEPTPSGNQSDTAPNQGSSLRIAYGFTFIIAVFISFLLV
ncbi:hypothetical protein EDC94DRAFT_613379 [Helicostylum pulchrum]|uniref:Copper acquisition factor BIM1-like domain-containing protein n=1 Tax=Helicostylum pulchrum TaxID=562976 RepID=A0ABP9XMT2_9FUNG|nr:hypothetical protein EDC94DRAFT_613379 [Helicostylum pulchrum]